MQRYFNNNKFELDLELKRNTYDIEIYQEKHRKLNIIVIER